MQLKFQTAYVNMIMKVKKTRISLAYAQLEEMPEQILANIAQHIQFLDLSYNAFTNLEFLAKFPRLHTLVLDRNLNLDCATLPKMQQLQVLWLNNCNLVNIEEWLYKLNAQCPQLMHLSMMCNPVGQTLLNGVTDADECAYRKQVAHIMPQLQYFDGVLMTQATSTKLSSMMVKQIEPGLLLWKNKLYYWLQHHDRQQQFLNTNWLQRKPSVSFWA